MSYQKSMKWNRRHPKGTRQTCIMHTESGFWPSISFLDKYFKYRELCQQAGIEPQSCEEYYYNPVKVKPIVNIFRMETGQTFSHRYRKGMTCTIKELTQKGARVLQSDPNWHRGKLVQQCYNRIDFDPVAGFWMLTTPTLNLGDELKRPERASRQQDQQINQNQTQLF